MKQIILSGICVLSLSALVTACTVDDEDRCTDQYEWKADQAGCVTPQDTEVTDTTPVQDGLGDECWSDTDCAEAGDYSYCLLDPTDPTIVGMCSYWDCTAAECGGDFACCDCTMTTITFLESWTSPICVDPGTAGILSSMCSCE